MEEMYLSQPWCYYYPSIDPLIQYLSEPAWLIKENERKIMIAFNKELKYVSLIRR